jgi:hypothetical protein
MKTIRRMIAVAALTLGASSVASAGTTSVNFESSADKSIRNLGSFSGTASYDDVAGLLTITINNTSAASGAHLTGLAFNVTGDGAARYMDGDITTTRGDEDLFDDARARRGKRLVKARPLGMFEAGAGINGRFNPPGRRLAARGVAAGSADTFSFEVTGGAGLTAADFLGGDNGLVAAFRSRRIDKVGSVIVPGSVTAPSTGGNSGGDEGAPQIDLPEIVPPIVPPVNTGGDTGNGDGGDNGAPPAAVPLPPAAIPALATFALLAVPRLKRKLRELL